MYEAYIKKINIYFARRRMEAARLFLPLISSFSSTKKKTSPREQKRWEQRESLFHRKNVCSIWLNSKILSWRKNPTKNFDDFIERKLFRKKKSATVSQPASQPLVNMNLHSNSILWREHKESKSFFCPFKHFSRPTSMRLFSIFGICGPRAHFWALLRMQNHNK